MKTNKKSLIVAVALPLAVGGLSALITGGAMKDFANINQPPLSPPGWLFPIAWTILYILMGVASWLIFVSKAPYKKKNNALVLYAIQLFFNFFWSIFFFKLNLYTFSLIWLIALLVLIIATAVKFKKISNTAFGLIVPYILWVCFACYLNLGVAILN